MHRGQTNMTKYGIESCLYYVWIQKHKRHNFSITCPRITIIYVNSSTIPRKFIVKTTPISFELL